MPVIIDKYGDTETQRRLKIPKERKELKRSFNKEQINLRNEEKKETEIVKTEQSPVLPKTITTNIDINETPELNHESNKPSLSQKVKVIFQNIVIRVLSVVLSGCALIRTFGYALEYYSNMDIAFYSLIMSFILVIASYVSPQVFVYSVAKKNWLVAVLSLAFTVITSYYNINLTYEIVSSKRQTVITNVASGNEVILRARDKVKDLENENEQLLINKQTELTEIDTLDKIQRSLLDSGKNIDDKGKETYTYTNGRTRLVNARERLAKIEELLATNNNEIEKLKNTEGYYSLIVDSSTDIQNKVSDAKGKDLVFAIFLDFVGPVFMAFSLFL